MDQICPKKIFLVENRESEHRHWILPIQISLVSKLQLKLTIMILWTKFAQKGYFLLETEKMIITIDLCIL